MPTPEPGSNAFKLIELFLRALHPLDHTHIGLLNNGMREVVGRFMSPPQRGPHPHARSVQVTISNFFAHIEGCGSIEQALNTSPFAPFMAFARRLSPDERSAIAKLLEAVAVELKKPKQHPSPTLI